MFYIQKGGKYWVREQFVISFFTGNIYCKVCELVSCPILNDLPVQLFVFLTLICLGYERIKETIHFLFVFKIKMTGMYQLCGIPIFKSRIY